MSNFSDCLQRHIEHSNKNKTELAEQTKISRTLLQKVVVGNRPLNDEKKMKALIDALILTPQEETELWDLYYNETFGKNRYTNYREVKNFIESFHPQGTINDSFFSVESMKKIPFSVLHIMDRYQLHYYITMIIEDELSSGSDKFSIMMQPDHTWIMTQLLAFWKDRADLSIEHIVCLESSAHTSDYEARNTSILSKLIPLLLLKSSYELFYYYDQIDYHLNDMSLFPNMILTKKYAILFDHQGEKGIISSDQGVIQLFQNKFQQIKSRCKPFGMRTTTIQDYLKETAHSLFLSSSSDTVTHISIQPCFFRYLSHPQIQKHLKKQFHSIIDMKAFQNHMRSLYNIGKLQSYFTKQGLISFMETGLLNEIPSHIYHPFSSKERYELLEAMYIDALKGIYQPCLIKQTQFHLPKEVIITSLGNDNVLFQYVSQHNDMFITFSCEETSTAKIFTDFMEYLQYSNMVYSHDETLHQIKAILNHYKKQPSSMQLQEV